jgi:hypothetical protein
MEVKEVWPAVGCRYNAHSNNSTAEASKQRLLRRDPGWGEAHKYIDARATRTP